MRLALRRAARCESRGKTNSLPGHTSSRCGGGLLPSLGIALLLLFGCFAVGAGESNAPDRDLVVHRGSFEPRYLLTGELRAAEAEHLVVPRTPGFQVQIRWMEENGAEVEAGQRVVEFDNSSVTSDLEDRRLTFAERETDLERSRSEAASAIAEKEFAFEQRQAELDKARIEAAVPRELLPARDYQERQLALQRAEVAVTKAQEDLAATREARRADVEMSVIDLAKARRKVEEAESAIDQLALTAPTSGFFVIEDHPWEGRKFQSGDSLFPGWSVARIPDLSTLLVEAVLYDVDESRIEAGMRARATPDAFPGLQIEGEVLEVAPVARELARSSLRRYFQVTVGLSELRAADAERLRPGMSVKVEVFGEHQEDVLLAPRQALDLTAEPVRAHLADGEAREVELGPCNPSQCVVAEGLQEGQRLAPRIPGESSERGGIQG